MQVHTCMSDGERYSQNHHHHAIQHGRLPHPTGIFWLSDRDLLHTCDTVLVTQCMELHWVSSAHSPVWVHECCTPLTNTIFVFSMVDYYYIHAAGGEGGWMGWWWCTLIGAIWVLLSLALSRKLVSKISTTIFHFSFLCYLIQFLSVLHGT